MTKLSRVYKYLDFINIELNNYSCPKH
jgi:hypothetical protein